MREEEGSIRNKSCRPKKTLEDNTFNVYNDKADMHEQNAVELYHQLERCAYTQALRQTRRQTDTQIFVSSWAHSVHELPKCFAALEPQTEVLLSSKSPENSVGHILHICLDPDQSMTIYCLILSVCSFI